MDTAQGQIWIGEFPAELQQKLTREVRSQIERIRALSDEDLTRALVQMYESGWYARQQRLTQAVCGGLPSNATRSQVCKRLGIPMREDRSVHSPIAVTRIRRALETGTILSSSRMPIRSVRGLANLSLRLEALSGGRIRRMDESTIRKVLKSERAELSTWQALAKAMGISTNALLY